MKCLSNVQIPEGASLIVLTKTPTHPMIRLTSYHIHPQTDGGSRENGFRHMLFGCKKSNNYFKNNLLSEYVRDASGMAYSAVLVSNKKAYSDIVQADNSSATSFQGWSPALSIFKSHCSWDPLPILHLINFGFQPSAMLSAIELMPPQLFPLFQEILHSISCTIKERSFLLAPFSEANWNGLEFGARSYACKVDPTPFNLHDDGLWESETILGLIEVEFDPRTQIRKHVSVNSRASLLWGLSRAELLERFARFDAPLPFLPLDWMCLLTLELEARSHDEMSYYTRLVFGEGGGLRTVLACICSLKTFTAASRVSKATTAPLHMLLSLLISPSHFLLPSLPHFSHD